MLNLLRHWFYIAPKVKLTFDLSSKATHIGLPYTYLSIFFSDFTGLDEHKFHMEYSVGKTINMILILGHLIKMATSYIWQNKLCLNNKP